MAPGVGQAIYNLWANLDRAQQAHGSNFGMGGEKVPKPAERA